MNLVVTIFFVLACMISYTILLYSSNTYSMAANYRFFFYKLAITLGILGMGYFSTLFAIFHEHFPRVFGRRAVVFMFKLFKYFDYVFVILSSLWFALAVALLPYGPVVIHHESNTIDREKTKILLALYQGVYVYPLVIISIIFFLNYTIFIAACGDHTSASNKTPIDLKEIYLKFRTIQPTLGYYFNLKGAVVDEEEGNEEDEEEGSKELTDEEAKKVATLEEDEGLFDDMEDL